MAKAQVADDGIVQQFADADVPIETGNGSLTDDDVTTSPVTLGDVRVALSKAMDDERKSLRKWIGFQEKIGPKMAALEADYHAKQSATAELFSLATHGTIA